MKVSARSILIAGITTITAGAVVIAPSVHPASPPRSEPAPAVELTAHTTRLADPAALSVWLAAAQRRAPNSAVSPLVAEQPAQAQALIAFPGLGNAIKNAYNVIEYWVDYGVDVATWAVGWIPFGWIAGDQIQIFYNDLIEPIARTITYNVADWIGGSVSFLQGVNNVVFNSANAGIGFLNAEIAWGWSLLPPLPFPPPQIPSLPWFSLQQAQANIATEEVTTASTGEGLPQGEALQQGGRTGVLSTAVHELTGVADGVEGIAETVRDRIMERRETRSLLADSADASGNRVVRAQGEVRETVSKAVKGVAKALRGSESSSSAEGTAKAPSPAAKNLADTARKVVKEVRQAAKNARDAAPKRTAPGADG